MFYFILLGELGRGFCCIPLVSLCLFPVTFIVGCFQYIWARGKEFCFVNSCSLCMYSGFPTLPVISVKVLSFSGCIQPFFYLYYLHCFVCSLNTFPSTILTYILYQWLLVALLSPKPNPLHQCRM